MPSLYNVKLQIDGPLYPGLGIRIELKRHLTYHVIQTYFPSVIFVTVAWGKCTALFVHSVTMFC